RVVVGGGIGGVGGGKVGGGGAMGRRAHNCLGGDFAGRTYPIFHDDLLAEPLRQPLRRQARNGVSWTASGIAHQQAHWSRWIAFLRPRDSRDRERGGTRCELQKASARKVHDVRFLIPPHRQLGRSRRSMNSLNLVAWTTENAG